MSTKNIWMFRAGEKAAFVVDCIGNNIVAALLALLLLCMSTRHCSANEADVKPHGKDHSSSIHSGPNAAPIKLPVHYLVAVKNARTATEKDVSRELTAVLSSNGKLRWREQRGKSQVLVATWTSRKSYYPEAGSTFTEAYQVWVTVAPELQDYCVAYRPGENGPPLPRRIEQLLGLPPHSGHKFVVELWVDPGDLFRPSADPEPTDHEAQLRFPAVRGFVAVSDQYKQWYQQSVRDRYAPKTGPPYPWTRLGYTYDWGNANSRVGLSEFVIRKGARLTVQSVSTTAEYAKKRDL